jgi:hypothetical protein
MTGVMRRSALFVAILVYVTLDLSLPAMPGAFVFDPGESVESVQHTRARAAAEAVILPAAARDAFALARVPHDMRDRPASTRPAAPCAHVPRRSGLLDEPAPPSEDPH